MARAAGTVAERARQRRDSTARSTLPILIHGDAAFPGQGIVAETLNLSRLAGYDTDGTIHIIANNQIGFTATPAESYSTSYASGLARGFKIPIVHVNADDPVACLEAARLAWEYRARFRPRFPDRSDRLPALRPQRRRRTGVHAAADVPGHRRAPDGARAVCRHADQAGHADARVGRGAREEALHGARAGVRVAEARAGLRRADLRAGSGRRRRTHGDGRAAGAPSRNQREPARPRRPASRFTRSSSAAGSAAAPRWRIRQERTVDWATAEELAFATILADGTPIRLTGEDVERGTFSQRHAVFHDAETGLQFVPLQDFPQARASFEIHNSALSENAAIGFEFGYNIQEPDRLVIWEAQYGDFINSRAGDPRSVRHVGAREMGTAAVARVAAAARLRGTGTRSTRARAPNDSCRPRPTSTFAW